MSSAKITLASFFTYFNTASPEDDLFKNMSLPSGIDKDTLVGNILMRGGEFEVMYSDPYFMQNVIGVWSQKWYRTIDKWVKALAIDYNPLENYDRMEQWTDTTDGSTSGRRDNGNTRTLNYTDALTLDHDETRTLDTTNTSTHDVSAYDSSSYQPADKTVTEDDGTDTMTFSGTDSTLHSGTITDSFGEGTSSKNNEKVIHNGRIHGNVGVTTSQQMLESELSLAEWNIYEHVTDLFLSEFVIPIYS